MPPSQRRDAGNASSSAVERPQVPLDGRALRAERRGRVAEARRAGRRRAGASADTSDDREDPEPQREVRPERLPPTSGTRRVRISSHAGPAREREHPPALVAEDLERAALSRRRAARSRAHGPDGSFRSATWASGVTLVVEEDDHRAPPSLRGPCRRRSQRGPRASATAAQGGSGRAWCRSARGCSARPRPPRAATSTTRGPRTGHRTRGGRARARRGVDPGSSHGRRRPVKRKPSVAWSRRKPTTHWSGAAARRRGGRTRRRRARATPAERAGRRPSGGRRARASPR